MIDKIKEFEQKVKNKHVCVIGIGISNVPLIRFLLKCGAIVSACDKKNRDSLGMVVNELESSGVSLKLGSDYLSNINADIVFKTPGLRYDIPELTVLREKGIIVTSEMEEFLKLCPAKVFAVTGSDGKTTTTTLIYKLLTSQGYTCHIGGNIGAPLLEKIHEISPEHFVVLELSSFQLQTIKNSPQVAVITNISPNHLDMHKDYEEYIDAKKNIMRFQNADDTLVINKDNAVTSAFAKEAKGKCITFSSHELADVCLVEGYITINCKRVLNISDIKIPGSHNVENYMAAIAATYPLITPENILKTARNFGGVPHRIELIRTLGGVRYYNSSIDSSPNRTINTLKVFKEPVILISGGKAKGISYDDIGDAILERAKALILIGETAADIESSVLTAEKKANKKLPIYHMDSYEEVVRLAKNIAHDGDVVLLSNASTSFDMFKNFEERGNYFKELVMKL